jgi:hypothetical protein
MAKAQKELTDAQALKRVIDENIATHGVNEVNIAQLQASNAALTAALESVKKAGFTGITIPELPTPGTKDPAKEFQDNVARGFAQMGQAMNAMAKYQRIMGKPLPEDPTQIADNAARMRLSVNDYVEQTYKLSETERTQTAAARQAEVDAAVAAGVKKYQEDHPSTSGHPDLNGGAPSNFAQMPKTIDAKDVRQYAALPAREKIAQSIKRATERMQEMRTAS